MATHTYQVVHQGAPGTPQSSRPCACSNCHEVDSNCGSTVCNNDYITPVHDKPPAQCCPRDMCGDFSPERRFYDRPTTSVLYTSDTIVKSVISTTVLREFDLQLPLPHDIGVYGPSMRHRTEDYQNVPPPSYPPPPLPMSASTPRGQFENHTANQSINNAELNIQHRARTSITTASSTQTQTKTPKEGRPKKVRWWFKLGTVISYLLFPGLGFAVVQSAVASFYEDHTNIGHRNAFWNSSEPPDSRLDATVCFSCEFISQASRWRPRTGDSPDMYSIKTVDNQMHCCLPEVGHVKWMMSMMKTQEIVQNRPITTGVCGGKMTHVPITSACSRDGVSSLQLDTDAAISECGGAGINVTRDGCVARRRGRYIVYVTITVSLTGTSSACAPKQTNEIQAHLRCNRSGKQHCIDMETWDITRKEYGFHVFDFYAVKEFEKGESFFPVLSHPSYLYAVPYGNYIDVIKL